MKLYFHPASTTCAAHRHRLRRLPQRARLAGPHEGLPSWGKVFEAIEGYGASLKGQPMMTL